MSDLPVLELLRLQVAGLRDDVRAMNDQLTVLTAIVLRIDRDSSRRDERDTDMLNELRAIVRQHQRFDTRLRAMEERE